MQEVALILAAIARLVKLDSARTLDEPRVVARGEVGAAESSHVVQRHAELDLAVAEHVGVWGPSSLVLTEEVLEYPIAILRGEAHSVQGNAEFLGNCARILEVLRGRAVAVAIVVPVAHEERLGVEALLLQEEGRDGGIDSAGEADNDALGGHGRIVRREGRGRCAGFAAAMGCGARASGQAPRAGRR